MKANKVIIIGAGPSGLSLGFELEKRKIDYQILEKGPDVGTSWKRMPNHLKMISPWYSNRLPSMDEKFKLNYRMPANDFADLLRKYQATFNLKVLCNRSVQKVTKENGRYKVTTQKETFESDTIVSCTGYFSNPVKPDIHGLFEGQVPVTLFSNFKSIGHLSIKPKSVLIIGKRLSAGQLLDECVKENIDVSISIRSHLKLGPSPNSLMAKLAFMTIPTAEKILVAIGRSNHKYDIRMQSDSVSRLLKEGKLNVYSEISHVQCQNGRAEVTFTSGKTKFFDHIFVAAGFKPAVSFLNELVSNSQNPKLLNHFESADAKGLFFLGLDGQRNFRSRFLRGIREDAGVLASILEKRMNANTSDLSKTVLSGD